MTTLIGVGLEWCSLTAGVVVTTTLIESCFDLDFCCFSWVDYSEDYYFKTVFLCDFFYFGSLWSDGDRYFDFLNCFFSIFTSIELLYFGEDDLARFGVYTRLFSFFGLRSSFSDEDSLSSDESLCVMWVAFLCLDDFDFYF